MNDGKAFKVLAIDHICCNMKYLKKNENYKIQNKEL